MPQTELNIIVLMFLKSPLVSLQGNEKEKQTVSITVNCLPSSGIPIKNRVGKKKSVSVSNIIIILSLKWCYSVQAV